MGFVFIIRAIAKVVVVVFMSYLAIYQSVNLYQNILPALVKPKYNPHQQRFVHESNNKNNHGNYIERSEKHHVALLKVHKTGSSTVQNIFLRFGDSRNLSFILPHDKIGLGETKYPNMISFSNSLTDTNIVPPPIGRHYEMLCCHVIYDSEQFHKYLPNETYYIGIVREPVSRLESSMRYFQSFAGQSMSEIAINPLKYDRGPHSMSNNRMAFEFGFPEKLFPKSGYIYENLQAEIDEYIKKLDTEFQLILVNEMMDESLVLMRRVLGWQIHDIIYLKQLEAKHETRRFNNAEKDKLKSFLYLDHALYNFAVNRLKEKIAESGNDFMEEVIRFKGIKDIVKGFCTNTAMHEDYIMIEESQWHASFSVTKEDCKLYTLYEIRFIQNIRRRMYGTLNI